MKKLSLSLVLFLLLSIISPVCIDSAYAQEAQETDTAVVSFTEAMNYASMDNWAYFGDGEDTAADVFFICPTVDTKSYANSEDLNAKLKGRFISAIDAEKGIYADTCRFYAPYYRQMSINAYALTEKDFNTAEKNAFLDICAAFRYYLDNENNGRPIVLAGFSQGGEMCINILKEFFGNTEEGNKLCSQLVAVYAIGWRITDDDIASYPQIVPASGETDTGTVICYECEDGSVLGSIIIPQGLKTHSINPLNWKTDSTPADSSLNKGAVFNEEDGAITEFCGAYIDENRGALIVPEVSTSDYPKVLDIFPDGCFHIYDNMFFYNNLKENVEIRTQTYLKTTKNTNVVNKDVTDSPKTGLDIRTTFWIMLMIFGVACVALILNIKIKNQYAET